MAAPLSSAAPRAHVPSVNISLVIPAFNEQATIAQAIAEAVGALLGITDDFEILVIDDGSSDATAELVEVAACQHSQVRLIRQPMNYGYGAALRRGFGEATKELVAFTDADCQFNLRELDRHVLLARDYPIVCGYRIDRQDSWLRCFYSVCYNVLVRTLLGTRVRDCDCALKMIRRGVLSKLPITTDGFLVNGELLACARQQNLAVVEVGVSHRPRAGGESKISILHVPVVLAALLRFWWTKVQFAGVSQPGIEPMWPARKQVAMSLVLVAIGAVLFFINLGYALFEPDEARYAQIALEMQQSGNWLVPTLHGEPYLDKPPLLYWLTVASYSLFGVSEWSARLPCALAALFTVLATYLLGRCLVGDRAAWASALLLLMCGGFIAAGRFIMMDGPLTLFTTVALLAAFRGLSTEKGIAWWVLCGTALGLGILTKGPVAPVLCLPPILALAWLTQNRELFRTRNLLAAILPAVVIAAPWFLMIAAEQAEFVGHFFWKHNFVRYTNAFDHQQPWWFYLPMLALGMLPVSLLLPALAVYLGRRTENETRLRSPELGALLLAAGWIVVFFSVSSCKLVTYILPAYPLLALALGKMITDIEWSPRRAGDRLQAWSRHAAWHGISFICWVAFGALIVQLVLNPQTQVLAAVFTLVPLAGLTLLYGRWLHSRRQLFAAALASYVLVAAYGFGFVVSEFANWRSIAHSAALVRAELGVEAPVVYFGRKSQAASFAISEGVHEFSIDQIAEFQEFMSDRTIAVVVANSTDCSELREKCGGTITLAGPQARSRIYVATRHAEVARAEELNHFRR
jgi:4-amino-4-deoxy-L-arabinose transferase-like glycosyltransferase